jgi:hypothetical protein
MMSKFVTEDPVDSATYFFQCATTHLDGTLVNANFVGQDQSIVVRAPGLWNAVVEAQQRCWVARASQPQRFVIRPILDDDFDVVQFLLKHRRKVV